MIKQREVLLIEFPQVNQRGAPKIRPCVVVSNDELFKKESIFYVVMLTTKPYQREYFFELQPEIFTQPGSFPSYARAHLVAFFDETKVQGRKGVMKVTYFNQLLDKIKTSIF